MKQFTPPPPINLSQPIPNSPLQIPQQNNLQIYNSNGQYNGYIDNGGGFNSQGSIYDQNGNYIGKVK